MRAMHVDQGPFTASRKRCGPTGTLAILVAGLLAGCGPVRDEDSHAAVDAYLQRADAYVVACIAPRALAPEDLSAVVPERVRPNSCSDAAKVQVEALYPAARHAVRLQRGTRMYLQRYHDRWTALTVRRSPEPGASGHASAELRRELDELATTAGKLYR